MFFFPFAFDPVQVLIFSSDKLQYHHYYHTLYIKHFSILFDRFSAGNREIVRQKQYVFVPFPNAKVLLFVPCSAMKPLTGEKFQAFGQSFIKEDLSLSFNSIGCVFLVYTNLNHLIHLTLQCQHLSNLCIKTDLEETKAAGIETLVSTPLTITMEYNVLV